MYGFQVPNPKEHSLKVPVTSKILAIAPVISRALQCRMPCEHRKGPAKRVASDRWSGECINKQSRRVSVMTLSKSNLNRIAGMSLLTKRFYCPR